MLHSRRDFLKVIGICALIVAGQSANSFALASYCPANEWVRELRKACDLLVSGSISATEWQFSVSRIYSQVNLQGLLKDLDFASLKEILNPAKPGGDWYQIFIDGLSNSAGTSSLVTKVVALRRGHSVPPHAHENEVSAFLTLQGEFRLRQWDRFTVEQDRVLVGPLRQSVSTDGDWSTQSERKTNIHWLLTDSDEAYFLSVRQTKIDGTPAGRERIFIDPDNSTQIDSNIYQMPIMEKSAWWHKYSRF